MTTNDDDATILMHKIVKIHLVYLYNNLPECFNILTTTSLFLQQILTIIFPILSKHNHEYFCASYQNMPQF